MPRAARPGQAVLAVGPHDVRAEPLHQRLEDREGRGDRPAIIDMDRVLGCHAKAEERHRDAVIEPRYHGRLFG